MVGKYNKVTIIYWNASLLPSGAWSMKPSEPYEIHVL